MKEQVRNTQKSRMVSEIADAIVGLVTDGEYSPSKRQITENLTKGSLQETASAAIYTTVFSEIANEVERYFAEACARASEALEMPDYHLVTRTYYSHFKKNVPPTPKSEVEARQYVCVFGNGKRGKAEGVRFVTPEDKPDPMFLVYAQKSTDVVSRAIQTHLENQKGILNSDQIPDGMRHKMAGGVVNIQSRISAGV